MKISEIEFAAIKSYNCFGKNLRENRNCQARRAREAVISMLYMLGCKIKDICYWYSIPNTSIMNSIVKDFSKRVNSTKCDNDTISFLKEVKELINGNKI